MAVQLKDEHNALSIVFIDDGKETSLQTAEKTLFNVYLDPKVRRGLKIEADDDKLSEYSAHSDLKLYKCTDEGGTYRITEVKTGPLFQTDLNSDVSNKRPLNNRKKKNNKNKDVVIVVSSGSSEYLKITNII